MRTAPAAVRDGARMQDAAAAGDRVLSVREPWVWMIFRLGKNIENRSRTVFWRGRLWIRASKTMPDDREACELILEMRRHLLEAGHATAEENRLLADWDRWNAAGPARGSGEHARAGRIVGAVRLAGVLDARSPDPARAGTADGGRAFRAACERAKADLLEGERNPWWEGPVGWLLRDPRLVRGTAPEARGYPGLTKLEAAVPGERAPMLAAEDPTAELREI